ncbi:hypothetical protein M011DRAFT_469915 [Sporormia fimetaria CBS 119925]|uniref:Nucleoporin Nup120/160 n=1 Tax=Sporormia fimetaria CBS 119925 TaxID=1340428 RepID=A0A6A6V569_9PLEO|nr:hypothetical protein M011DRAFT_469915 [Sporormia fimetaria CBS 119925]
MAWSSGTCLYKETRLNTEPAFPGSTISITLPTHDNSTFGTRTQGKRTIVTEQSSDRDEDAFAKRHLANHGSMFFRTKHEYPRSFLWRLLDNRRTLQIQAVDLDHDLTHELEANVTILLRFASPIRPFCVAFAEPDGRDAVTVFAITKANEFYTISLHRDFFLRPAASEQEISDWCKTTSLAQLSVYNPYRLFAHSNEEVLVSLDNSALLLLKRSDKDEALWDEIIFQGFAGWPSMRYLLSWRGEQKVKLEDMDLDLSAACAAEFSPDGKHIWTVCLNHTLKAWNRTTGKPGMQVDLLGDPEQPGDKAPSYVIEPAQASLMAVLNIPGGVDGALYHVVTYSPKQHQFVFWGVRDADAMDNGIHALKTEIDFIPPVDELMNTTAWTLSEFCFKPGPTGWRGTELWIRARSGPSSKVYMLRFDMNDNVAALKNAWKNDWVSVDPGPLSVEQLRYNPANPAELGLDELESFDVDVTQRWLNFLFYPGRFTAATLEAALLVFRRGLERVDSSQAKPKGSLKERLCATVSAFTSLGQKGLLNHTEFQSTLATQWQAFYSLVRDLHKRRGEHLALAFDTKSGTPWLVLNDYLSAIRLCSDPEKIALNSDALESSHAAPAPLQRMLESPEQRQVVRLLMSAASFRRGLPEHVQAGLQREVEHDILQNRSLSIVDRMELIEANCNLTQHVSDDDVSALVEGLPVQHVRELNSDMFFRAILSLGEEQQGRSMRRQITRVGLNALLTVSQEILPFNKDVLLDLLSLILFLQYEEDLPGDFDAPEVFVEIINQLKDNTVLSWMAGTMWSNVASWGPASETLLKSLSEASKSRKQLPITQTVLEGVLGHRSFDVQLPEGLHTDLLTYWSRVWLAHTFTERQDFETVVGDFMGILLVQEEYGLAFQFSRYLPENSWPTYLKGRTHLAHGEDDLASICFRKAAYNLGEQPPSSTHGRRLSKTATRSFDLDDADMKSSLIPPEQRDSFSEGLPRYYNHVLSLFERYKSYAYVVDFAHLGLQCLQGTENEELRTDLLTRLFHASIKTSRFDDAYSAMTRHTNAARRSSALQTLITSMISASQTSKLLSYPFLSLTQEVDSILLSLCYKTLNISSGPPYHLILYSFRIRRNDFRGAASILHDRLQRLKSSSSQVHDPRDERMAQCYLMIINTLENVGKEDAYILADQRVDVGGKNKFEIGKAKMMLKRKVVTLDMLRKEYQAELDRVEAIEEGRFPLIAAEDEMDIL